MGCHGAVIHCFGEAWRATTSYLEAGVRPCNLTMQPSVHTSPASKIRLCLTELVSSSVCP